MLLITTLLKQTTIVICVDREHAIFIQNYVADYHTITIVCWQYVQMLVVTDAARIYATVYL